MSCYYPLRAVVLGTKPNGKKNIKILKNSDFKFEYPGYEYIKIPCGHCIGCRLKYSRVWADRCMAEASYYDHNVFLTLTYDNDHLPTPNKLEDGTDSPINPLVKRDLQLFIKRLRKKLSDQKIRYFACGEYGGKSGRPHYHLILFNCRLDDVELLVRNEKEFRYYTSNTISDCWKYGFHIITQVNWNTCAYVARYVVKKQVGVGSDVYGKYNFPPEFTIMSRKPGIGRQYFEDHALDIYYDGAFISTEAGAHRIYPNKYYDDLFDIQYPDCSVVLKDKAKEVIDINERLKSNLTSLSYLDRLKSEEVNKIAQTRILQRKEV